MLPLPLFQSFSDNHVSSHSATVGGSKFKRNFLLIVIFGTVCGIPFFFINFSKTGEPGVLA